MTHVQQGLRFEINGRRFVKWNASRFTSLQISAALQLICHQRVRDSPSEDDDKHSASRFSRKLGDRWSTNGHLIPDMDTLQSGRFERFTLLCAILHLCGPRSLSEILSKFVAPKFLW